MTNNEEKSVPCTAAGHAVWTLAGEALEALDVPEYLGPGIVAALSGRSPTVIEVPGDPARWRFLIRPRSTRAAFVAALVELPPTRVRGGELTWLHAPAGPLPTFADVVTALVTDAGVARESHGILST